MITYCIVTAFFNTLAAVILGGLVLWRAPRRPENYLFACFATAFAAWSLAYLFWQLAATEGEALFYARILTAAAGFIPVTYFHFVCRLTSYDGRREIGIGYAVVVAVSVFTFSPYLVKEVAPAMMFPYWPRPGPVFWPWLAAFLYFVIRAWMVLSWALRSATHWHKRQIGYVYFGSVMGWVGGLTNLFLWFNIPIPPIGNALSLAYMISVGYAMLQVRLADRKVVVVKSVVYFLVVGVMTMLYPVTTALLRHYVPEDPVELVNTLDYVGALLITLALFSFIPRFNRQFDAFLEERAFGDLAEARNRLREHIRRISTISDLDTIFSESVSVVADALGGARVELFCRHEFEGDYGRQAGSIDGESFFSSRLGDEDWLVSATRSSGKALVVYEQERSGDAAKGIAECNQAGVEIAVPIHADRLFYGLLLCGGRRDKRLYSNLDISLLETLCIQIGLTIRARELERRANRTEKLISLGTLAAGLAHELRNPLVSIRTFTGLIGEQGEDPEFLRQFGSVVERDVNRIGAIVDQVAAFASNANTSFASVDLLQIVHDVHDIAKDELKEAGVALSIEEASLPSMRGNYNQLIQVFLNLLQNAVQALGDTPSPEVRIGFQARRGKDGNNAVLVSIADNGPGIPAGILKRIFDPFVTTKNTGPRGLHRGMGLGLGIVKSIVEAHGGTIEVATTTGAGTTFFVELPCSNDSKSVGLEQNGSERSGETSHSAGSRKKQRLGRRK